MNIRTLGNTARNGTVKTLSALFPNYFGAIGTKLFLQPRTLAVPPLWPNAFDGFTRETLQVGAECIPTWRSGNGPVVILVHGWEHDHTSLGGFVSPLLDQGLTVVALDLPAHGLATGRLAPLPLMAQAIAAVGKKFGPVHGVIAHSVGGAMSVLATERYGLEAQRLVLIGAPQGAKYQAISQGRSSGLSRRALTRMVDQIDAALGEPLEGFRVDTALAQARCNTLIIHAQDDRVVSIEAARHNASACNAATLWLHSGGHNRPLGDANVIRGAIRFLQAGAEDESIPLPTEHQPALSALPSLTDKHSI